MINTPRGCQQAGAPMPAAFFASATAWEMPPMESISFCCSAAPPAHTRPCNQATLLLSDLSVDLLRNSALRAGTSAALKSMPNRRKENKASKHTEELACHITLWNVHLAAQPLQQLNSKTMALSITPLSSPHTDIILPEQQQTEHGHELKHQEMQHVISGTCATFSRCSCDRPLDPAALLRKSS